MSPGYESTDRDRHQTWAKLGVQEVFLQIGGSNTTKSDVLWWLAVVDTWKYHC